MASSRPPEGIPPASPALIGQAQSRGNDYQPAFSGPCGVRLAKLLDLEHGDLLERVFARNVLDRWPGKNGKGDAFPMDEARRAVLRMRIRGRPVVLVGKTTAAAFDVRREFFEWFALRGKRAVVIPHPSGVNLWYNDGANRERIRPLRTS